MDDIFDTLAYVLGTTAEDVAANPELAYELYAALEDVEAEAAIAEWGQNDEEQSEFALSETDAEVIAAELGTSVDDVLDNPELALELYTLPDVAEEDEGGGGREDEDADEYEHEEEYEDADEYEREDEDEDAGEYEHEEEYEEETEEDYYPDAVLARMRFGNDDIVPLGGVEEYDEDANEEVIARINAAEADGSLAGEFETLGEADDYASAAPNVLRVYAVYNRWGNYEVIYAVLREYEDGL